MVVLGGRKPAALRKRGARGAQGAAVGRARRPAAASQMPTAAPEALVKLV